MNNNTLPDLIVPYNTTFSQSFDTDDLDAESVQFVMVNDEGNTVLVESPLEVDPEDQTRLVADLTLSAEKTMITSQDNLYKLMLIYSSTERVRLPEPTSDCLTGDCNLPKLMICDIPADS